MIVLLTDFGNSEYVGVMKGVMASIAPDVKIADLCNTIAPQSIIEGAWVLSKNYKFFPHGSVFCCIVDPSVGSKRRAIAIKTKDFYFIGPDNGLLWESVKDDVVSLREIKIPENASKTFHGRDIFAIAAAEIELGKFDDMGDLCDDMVGLELKKEMVVRIDGFGNIITNLKHDIHKNIYKIKLNNNEYQLRYYETYSKAEKGQLFVIEGSADTLEISLKNSNANAIVKAKSGDKIECL